MRHKELRGKLFGDRGCRDGQARQTCSGCRQQESEPPLRTERPSKWSRDATRRSVLTRDANGVHACRNAGGVSNKHGALLLWPTKHIDDHSCPTAERLQARALEEDQTGRHLSRHNLKRQHHEPALAMW